jgi:hypothetical protein
MKIALALTSGTAIFYNTISEKTTVINVTKSGIVVGQPYRRALRDKLEFHKLHGSILASLSSQAFGIWQVLPLFKVA